MLVINPRVAYPAWLGPFDQYGRTTGRPFPLPPSDYYGGTQRICPTWNDLTAASDVALPGDVIVYSNDIVCGPGSGPTNRTLPRLPLVEAAGGGANGKFVRLVAANFNQSIAAGTRVQPADFVGCPKFLVSDTTTNQGFSPLFLEAAATGWDINGICIEYARAQSNAWGGYLFSGAPFNGLNAASDQPHHNLFRHNYINNPYDGASYWVGHGVYITGYMWQLLDNFIAGICAPNSQAESHGVWMNSFDGDILLENNFIEALSMNVFFGGAPQQWLYPLFRNVAVRRNHLYRRPAWHVDPILWPPDPDGAGPLPRPPGNEKNFIEYKNAAGGGFYEEGNVCENFAGNGQQFNSAMIPRAYTQAEAGQPPGHVKLSNIHRRLGVTVNGWGMFNLANDKKTLSGVDIWSQPGVEDIEIVQQLCVSPYAGANLNNVKNQFGVSGNLDGKTLGAFWMDHNTMDIAHSFLQCAAPATQAADFCEFIRACDNINIANAINVPIFGQGSSGTNDVLMDLIMTAPDQAAARLLYEIRCNVQRKANPSTWGTYLTSGSLPAGHPSGAGGQPNNNKGATTDVEFGNPLTDITQFDSWDWTLTDSRYITGNPQDGIGMATDGTHPGCNWQAVHAACTGVRQVVTT